MTTAVQRLKATAAKQPPKPQAVAKKGDKAAVETATSPEQDVFVRRLDAKLSKLTDDKKKLPYLVFRQGYITLQPFFKKAGLAFAGNDGVSFSFRKEPSDEAELRSLVATLQKVFKKKFKPHPKYTAGNGMWLVTEITGVKVSILVTCYQNVGAKAPSLTVWVGPYTEKPLSKNWLGAERPKWS